ncbi:ATP-binding cassette domain-containing protein [Cupriavidus basilensis]|uniref:ATP-binding cassette domain-containing protein n=1 Tax=Cupriavidus basilensis TaxID=68895 RepID=A0ABT6ARE3_9BURK|nr:ATP-binding cassette domain-containing protein [Cupriavidus basilensis]MDF3835157.1 ATP-binding cassette domain-containing protein [Cupriavidus basilensis]
MNSPSSLHRRERAAPAPFAGDRATGHAVAQAAQRPGPSGAGSVSFEHLGKVFHSPAGDVHALRDIGVEIPAGRIFGIIGRSGAGKSSLLRTINRLERPTTGRVLVDGNDIGALDERGLVSLRRRIGMIFQHFNLLSAKTVWDNVALPLKVAGVPRAEIAQRVEALLALVGLEAKHRAYPGRLSGGQKQRVGIARALVHRPEILLCDEATSALDPETTQSILALLRDINHRFGLTIVLITHEMRVIREICDNVLVLEGGRVAEHGPVWQVFGNPRHDATRALLQPLQAGLPDDLARLLQPTPPAHGAFEQLIELHYTGSGDAAPELARIATALGGQARLLHAGLDRIQGHTQGRLLLAAAGAGLSAETLASHRLSQHAKVLGYVPAHD